MRGPQRQQGRLVPRRQQQAVAGAQALSSLPAQLYLCRGKGTSVAG